MQTLEPREHRPGRRIGTIAGGRPHRAARLLAVVLAVLALFHQSNAHADAIPIATTSAAETNAGIAGAPATGEYLVVWEREYSTSDHDIAAQRVAADGSLIGGQRSVVWTGASQSAPAVAHHPTAGEYLVVWQERVGSDEFTQNDVHAQRLDADGDLLGSSFVVTDEGRSEDLPSVAFNPQTGEYLVVWQRRWTASDHDILARRVSAGGVLLGTGPIAIDTSGEDQLAPAVAVDTNSGRFLVVWQEQDPATASHDIHGQRLLGTGVAVGAELTIGSWEYDLITPRVAFNSAANEFLVVWEDHRWGWGAARDIYGQRISSGGNLVGSNFAISWEGDNARTAPDVAYDAAAGDYLVAWEYAFSADDHDVYRRRVDAGGSLPDAEVALSALGSDEGHPAVASSGVSAFLVVWEDGRTAAANGLDIYGAAVPVPRFSGQVFAGEVGDESRPLGDIQVALHCSADAGAHGAVVDTATTDTSGRYALRYADVCEFYNVVETDPTDYVSIGATSAGGTVIDSNSIQYVHPLGSTQLAGDRFWDSTDPPPGEWQRFAPAGWVVDRTPTARVQVRDIGSGLDVSTAQYAYSANAGAGWSAWQPAACSGADGSRALETLTAANVPFGQDSGITDLNRVRFRIADLASHWGTSPDFSVPIDATPPSNPQLQADRPTGTWSRHPAMQIGWSGAADATSGVAGYSYQWFSDDTGAPDTALDTSAGSVASSIPGEGHNWHFALRTVDAAGNWSGAVARIGPFYLDTSPPLNPDTLTSTSHSLATWTDENRITWQWSPGSDALSGLAGYSYFWTESAIGTPDLAVDGTARAVTSGPLDDGQWYFHLRVLDNVGIGAGDSLHGP